MPCSPIAWQGHPREPEVAIVFWTQAAQRLTVLLGSAGFFEAYSNGYIDLCGDPLSAAAEDDGTRRSESEGVPAPAGNKDLRPGMG